MNICDKLFLPPVAGDAALVPKLVATMVRKFVCEHFDSEPNREGRPRPEETDMVCRNRHLGAEPLDTVAFEHRGFRRLENPLEGKRIQDDRLLARKVQAERLADGTIPRLQLDLAEADQVLERQLPQESAKRCTRKRMNVAPARPPHYEARLRRQTAVVPRQPAASSNALFLSAVASRHERHATRSPARSRPFGVS